MVRGHVDSLLLRSAPHFRLHLYYLFSRNVFAYHVQPPSVPTPPELLGFNAERPNHVRPQLCGNVGDVLPGRERAQGSDLGRLVYVGVYANKAQEQYCRNSRCRAQKLKGAEPLDPDPEGEEEKAKSNREDGQTQK